MFEATPAPTLPHLAPDYGFLAVVALVAFFFLGLAWLAGRSGWSPLLSGLAMTFGMLMLTAMTLGWLIESPYLMFVPRNQSMMHAGGAAIAVILGNAIVVAMVWLAVLFGLRALGASRRRRA